MESVLGLYEKGYDSKRPVICMDERPCFLIGDTVKGIAMKQDKPAKENYGYSKHGSCVILAAIEPKTGRRIVNVRKRRRKKEFAYFMKYLASQYPDAEVITVVLDNLNTHNFSSFYEVFDAEQAERLTKRFHFVHTPKKASWLNMIEIEFSALSRQCLNRRIPSINELSREVLTYFNERSEKQIKIKWQFTCNDARKQLNRHYSKVNSVNQKYK